MQTILNIFENYGWSGIIVIILIAALYYLLKQRQKEFKTELNNGLNSVADKITDSITSQNSKLVDAMNMQNEKLIDYIVSSKDAERSRHDTMVSDRMNVSSEVMDKIKIMMHHNNANRVIVIEFHNSYQNMNGIPFAKYSCTYEWFQRGIAPIAQKCLNMPYSSLSNVMDDVYKSRNGIVTYNTLDEFKLYNPTLYSWLSEDNAKALIYSAMYDNKNNIIGFIIFEYHSEIPSHIDYNEISLDTAAVSSIINLNYKYS